MHIRRPQAASRPRSPRETNRRDTPWRLCAVAFCVATLVLGACTYRGQADDPISRRLSYFSFVGGDDIRAGCAPDAPERYRFVYNAVYWDQVRSYEIGETVAEDGAILDTAVYSPRLNEQLKFRFPLWPWKGRRATTRLDAEDMAELRRLLEASEFLERPPVGTILDSDSYYWLAMGCVEGRFHFNAYAYPSRRFENLRFAAFLERVDRTDVPFARPGQLSAMPADTRDLPARANDRGGLIRFKLRVGEDGLAGRL